MQGAQDTSYQTKGEISVSDMSADAEELRHVAIKTRSKAGMLPISLLLVTLWLAGARQCYKTRKRNMRIGCERRHSSSAGNVTINTEMPTELRNYLN